MTESTGANWKAQERRRLQCAANLIEPVAQRMMREGKIDGFKAGDRKAYLEYHDGAQLMMAIEKMRKIHR